MLFSFFTLILLEKIETKNIIQAFSEHHLKGEKPKDWIVEGRSYLKKKERKRKK